MNDLVEEMAQRKKLKLNKKFAPLPMDDGDEFFRNGIFEFSVTQMLTFIEANPGKFPIEQIPLSTLIDYGGGDRLDQKTILNADLSKPILMAEISPGRFNVIDGNHRLERARRENAETIPARRIFVEEHVAFLKSVRAYEAYVAYWNEKVERAR